MHGETVTTDHSAGDTARRYPNAGRQADAAAETFKVTRAEVEFAVFVGVMTFFGLWGALTVITHQ